jgi:hypothetical protein
MTIPIPQVARVAQVALLAGCVAAFSALAFPPAPHHTVFGTVRDEQGNPLRATGAEVLLEANGVAITRAPIADGSEPGVNYTLTIPLDSGATADLYKPTALRPTVPFRMRVKIGNTIYLPIEMTGASNLLTRPGERSRVNLTLGVDSDGDGLPDAWERALIQMLGGGLTLSDIRPDDDSDGDGMTNMQEYLAGTYAFDPEDGFALTILSTAANRPLLEFVSIRNRTYSLYSSTDMQTWVSEPFTLQGDAATAPGRAFYRAPDTRLLRVRVGPFVPVEGVEEAPRFFKVMVH